MTTTIASAVATLFLIVGVWAADLVCYHPDNSDLTAPIKVTTSWK